VNICNKKLLAKVSKNFNQVKKNKRLFSRKYNLLLNTETIQTEYGSKIQAPFLPIQKEFFSMKNKNEYSFVFIL